MKGTFFQKPLEFSLVVEGEAWAQGDSLSGVLTVKNHGQAEAPADGIQVNLARAAYAKVKQKAPNAFTILATAKMDSPAAIPPQGSATLPWKFATDRNAAITDGSGSLFVIYGKGTSPETVGHLEAEIRPYGLIQEFLDLLNIEFRFVFKSRRASKGRVEIKLSPPESKAMSNVELLVMLFHFEDEILHVDYSFNVKRMDAAAGMVLKPVIKEYSRDYSAAEYRGTGGRINHDRMGKSFGEILEDLRATLFA